jgi:hypothetical protein
MADGKFPLSMPRRSGRPDSCNGAYGGPLPSATPSTVLRKSIATRSLAGTEAPRTRWTADFAQGDAGVGIVLAARLTPSAPDRTLVARMHVVTRTIGHNTSMVRNPADRSTACLLDHLCWSRLTGGVYRRLREWSCHGARPRSLCASSAPANAASALTRCIY